MKAPSARGILVVFFLMHPQEIEWWKAEDDNEDIAFWRQMRNLHLIWKLATEKEQAKSLKYATLVK